MLKNRLMLWCQENMSNLQRNIVDVTAIIKRIAITTVMIA